MQPCSTYVSRLKLLLGDENSAFTRGKWGKCGSRSNLDEILGNVANAKVYDISNSLTDPGRLHSTGPSYTFVHSSTTYQIEKHEDA